jgi:Protein of unknown function (DUF3592)
MSKAVGAFLIFFILFWSAITLVFDRQILQSGFQQLGTTSFQETQGRIVNSSVKTHEDHEGADTYSLEVSYRYEVRGKEYFSNRYRYKAMSTNDGFAHRMSEELYEGVSIPVYFNPARPSEAVLVRGMEGIDLFTILFITPFNMVMLGGWWAIFIWAYRRYKKPEAGGVKYLEQGRHTVFKLHYKSPLATAMVTIGASTFLGVFAVAFPFGFHPSLVLMGIVWTVILSVTAYFTYNSWRQNQSGEHDLIIDDSRQTVSFCPMQINLENVTLKDLWKVGQFSARVSVHRSQIQNIFIESKTTTDSDGDSKTNYFATIQWQQQAVLMMTTDKEQVEEFVAWLRRRIGVTAHA